MNLGGIAASDGLACHPIGPKIDQGPLCAKAAIVMLAKGIDYIDQPEIGDGQAGFLHHLTHSGFTYGFAQLLGAAWDAPFALAGRLTAFDQQAHRCL